VARVHRIAAMKPASNDSEENLRLTEGISDLLALGGMPSTVVAPSVENQQQPGRDGARELQSIHCGREKAGHRSGGGPDTLEITQCWARGLSVIKDPLL
jgi:hypothetical protein